VEAVLTGGGARAGVQEHAGCEGVAQLVAQSAQSVEIALCHGTGGFDLEGGDHAIGPLANEVRFAVT
jgi:hypothetical protein